MARWLDVERLALALPGTAAGASRDLRVWKVKGKTFVWHFDNYAIVLARLQRLGLEELRELVVEAWLARAPKRLAKAYADSALED